MAQRIRSPMRRRSLSAFVVLCATAFTLSFPGCSGKSNDDRRTSPGVAPCPTVTVRTRTTLPQVSHDIHGRFTEACIRAIFGSGIVLPDLSPRWVRDSFAFSLDTPTDLRVFFEPAESDDPRVVLEIYPQREGYSGGDTQVTSASGHMFGAGNDTLGYTGYWSISDGFYAAHVLERKDSPETQDLAGLVVDAVWLAAAVQP